MTRVHPHTLGVNKRLKSKKIIDEVFTGGKSVSSDKIVIKYLPHSNQQESVKATFAVSKRFFKKAVDRNYLKRAMRESYRKNQQLVSQLSLYMVFIFIGKTMVNQPSIEEEIIQLMQKIQTRLTSS